MNNIMNLKMKIRTILKII